MSDSGKGSGIRKFVQWGYGFFHDQFLKLIGQSYVRLFSIPYGFPQSGLKNCIILFYHLIAVFSQLDDFPHKKSLSWQGKPSLPATAILLELRNISRQADKIQKTKTYNE